MKTPTHQPCDPALLQAVHDDLLQLGTVELSTAPPDLHAAIWRARDLTRAAHTNCTQVELEACTLLALAREAVDEATALAKRHGYNLED